MASPYHHSLSSVKKWGGDVDDYLATHEWLDGSKELHGDFRHRMLRHHSQGIYEAARVFGDRLTLSSGRVIPTRWVGEQHVVEDCGFIPSLSDWCKQIQPAAWMNRPSQLSQSTTSPHTPAAERDGDAVADRRWCAVINQALQDRDRTLPIVEIDQEIWDSYIGAMLNGIEDQLRAS